MLQSVPQIGTAKPRLLASFSCPTFIIIQVIGANTLYLGETEQAVSQIPDSGLIDGLQINQQSGIVSLWWNGDLWASGSAAFLPLIVIPGITTGSALDGQPVFALGATP